jgi:hypothetical protein
VRALQKGPPSHHQRQNLLIFERSRYLSDSDTPNRTPDPVEAALADQERQERVAYEAEQKQKLVLLCKVELSEIAYQRACGHVRFLEKDLETKKQQLANTEELLEDAEKERKRVAQQARAARTVLQPVCLHSWHLDHTEEHRGTERSYAVFWRCALCRRIRTATADERHGYLRQAELL